jgi:2-amino-4-hydroxy-6-hydroxymethyldihydropteridine diphosphokinase
VYQVKNYSTHPNRIYLALGSNQTAHLKDSVGLIKSAYELLIDSHVKLTIFSPFYQTPAFPVGNGPDYVNAVVAGETYLGPQELLVILHDIEQQLGRERVERWGARTVDIDLLDYAGCVLPTSEEYCRWRDMSLDLQKTTWPNELILPHPRIQDRGFVLVPLKAVAPNWVHPVSSESIDDLIERIDAEELQKIVEI